MHTLVIKGNSIRDISTAMLRLIKLAIDERPFPEYETYVGNNGSVTVGFNKYRDADTFSDLMSEDPDFGTKRDRTKSRTRSHGGKANAAASKRSQTKERSSTSCMKRQYLHKKCEKCGEMFRPRSGNTKYCDNCASPDRRKHNTDQRIRAALSDPSTKHFHGIKSLPDWSIEQIALLPEYAREKFRVHMTKSEKEQLRRITNQEAISFSKNKLNRISVMADSDEATS